MVSDGTVGETCLDVQQRFVSCIQFYNMIQIVNVYLVPVFL